MLEICRAIQLRMTWHHILVNVVLEYPQLINLIEVWPKLPVELRQVIVKMVRCNKLSRKGIR